MARDDCCESCEDSCPCIGGFPQLWAIFLLFVLGGGANLGAALYALISHKTSVLRFSWDAPHLHYINAAVLGTAIGTITLVLALLTWSAFRGGACAAIFKVVFAVVLLLCVGANCAVAAGALKVYIGLDDQGSKFSDAFDAAWRKDVARNTTTICDVQRVLKCEGYYPGDCRGVRAAEEDRCDKSCPRDSASSLPDGCYFRSVSFFRKWNLPLAVASIFSALLSLIAFVILIFSVSFNLAKQRGNM